jgi:hypothetical protein
MRYYQIYYIKRKKRSFLGIKQKPFSILSHGLCFGIRAHPAWRQDRAIRSNLFCPPPAGKKGFPLLSLARSLLGR